MLSKKHVPMLMGVTLATLAALPGFADDCADANKDFQRAFRDGVKQFNTAKTRYEDFKSVEIATYCAGLRAAHSGFERAEGKFDDAKEALGDIQDNCRLTAVEYDDIRTRFATAKSSQQKARKQIDWIDDTYATYCK